MSELTFDLRVGDQVMSATVQVPAEPIRPVELLPVLQKFSDGLIGIATAKCAPISCKAGCGACCRQLVPISETEAIYLARVIADMAEERQARVRRRFAEAVAGLEGAGMRERLRPEALGDPETRTKTGRDYFALGMACPFLEEESCSIHPHRPLSCREYLVTSPAVCCSAPSAETVRMAPLPVKLSHVLYRFGDGKGEEAPRFLPLPMLLEFAAAHAAEEQGRAPGPEMFRNFLERVAAGG